jgi:hypothetical protein
MYLKHRESGNFVEILDIGALIDPCKPSIKGRFHAGEEMQEPMDFNKPELVFPSNEDLPRCWLDPHYQEVRPRG